MNLTKINNNVQSRLNKYLLNYQPLMSIVKQIDKKGGRALLVGGAVRDLLLGIEVKDFDIEVHKIGLSELQDILQMFGPVSLVGKSFGVLRLHGLDVDWSLPRVDSVGRKPLVKIDPHMGFESSFLRRDLTINAMGIDLMSYNLIDPFGGVEHLSEKILHATSKHQKICLPN